MNTIAKKILPYGLVLIGFCGIYNAFIIQFPLIIMWLLACVVLASFAYARKYFPQNNMILIDLYLIWNLICILRGCFVAQLYWDWKQLIGTGFGMLMPVLCYVFASPRCDSILMRNFIKSAIIFFLLLLFFSSFTDRPGRYLTFAYLFMICISGLSNKWKTITLAIVFFSCFYDFDARSNAIRAIVALLIGLLFYIRYYIYKYLKFVQRVALIMPIFLFCLAVTSAFNIFKINEYWGDHIIQQIENGKVKKVNLSADTRTLLYDEVIASAIKNKHVLLGRTPARGYESVFFTFSSSEDKVIGIRQGERYGTEVSILNIFLHTGLIGVLLYFLIFCYASYLAICKSRNIYIKLIGIFIAFRWCYGWVEDFNQFDINYAMLWLFIAMCFSTQFRMMTNRQFRVWLSSITHK